MLKGRRSSTPSQKEKDKKDKPSKKEARSASTSVLRSATAQNHHQGSSPNHKQSASFSYSTTETRTDSFASDSYSNNVNNHSDQGESPRYGGLHWSERLCETVLLVLNEAGSLHFEIEGGADDGKFPFIGPMLTSPEEAGVTVQSLTSSGESMEAFLSTLKLLMP